MKKLRHRVLLNFKKATTPEQVLQVEIAFNGLASCIPVITEFEWGVNISDEKKDHGFTHCYLLTFASEPDMDQYINSPYHKAFLAMAKPFLDDVLVVAYWASSVK